ncbi:unnamed protein product, partial [Didymodactylos carnosus]
LNMSPYKNLCSLLSSLCIDYNIDWYLVENDIPKKWRVYGDMLLISNRYFSNDLWKQIPNELLWQSVCKAFSSNVKRIGLEGVIKNNDYRSPTTRLVYGNDPWVLLIENGIRFTYNIEKCMFCAGNNTERMRVGTFDCSNEVIVDLYAGIGYFTLAYLVHARASHVYACEWNSDAVEALKRNLKLNHVDDKCTVLYGNNEETCPLRVADRVNLGLIPSSEQSWPVACRALKCEGGHLHVHGTISTIKVKENQTLTVKDVWNEWGEYVRNEILKLMSKLYSHTNYKCDVEHIECVKPYGPHLDHLVVDLYVQKL